MDNQISKLADRPFVLGYFLPSILFVVAFVSLHPDWLPGTSVSTAPIEKWSAFASVALYSWFIAILLALFNREMMRLIEGYYWPISRISFFRNREKNRFQRITAKIHDLQNKKPLSSEQALELTDLWSTWLRNFPFEPHQILPTRFGNALRAFESYSGRVYKADAVIIWPRLVSVIHKDYMSLLGDCRARVNFFVNLLYLSAVFGIHVLLVAAWRILVKSDASRGEVEFFILIFAASIVLSVFSYVCAVQQAKAWGDLVKSAFDNYLPDLAKQLGYKLPDTLAKQQQFWLEVSQQATFHQSLKPENWQRASETNAKDSKTSPPLDGQIAKSTSETESENMETPNKPVISGEGDNPGSNQV